MKLKLIIEVEYEINPKYLAIGGRYRNLYLKEIIEQEERKWLDSTSIYYLSSYTKNIKVKVQPLKTV
jgi:hypothetical protein